VDDKAAVIGFSQGEKIKSGLIWITQAVDLIHGLEPPARRGAQTIIQAFMEMVVAEIALAARVTEDPAWGEAAHNMDMALTMFRSGVPMESAFHITRTLTHVTAIAGRSMAHLKGRGMI
jgi:hypothetical protein